MSTPNTTGDRRPMTKLAIFALLAAALAAAAITTAACSDDSSAVKEEPNPNGDGGSSSGIMPTMDSAVVTPPMDGGNDSGPTDCVQNPQTHEEIINACTNATRIPKSPNLPLLLPDGGLPTIM